MKAGPLEFRHHTKITEYPAAATNQQVLTVTTDTLELTHPYVRLNSTAGACTVTVPNGEESQLIVINHQTAADDIDITCTTCSGFSTIAMDEVGDQLILFYVDDTVGWIIISALAADGTGLVYTAA